MEPKTERRGRPRRPIDEHGYLTCSRCKERRHVTEFSQSGPWTAVTYFAPEDTEHRRPITTGNPGGYCKPCQAAYMRERYYKDRRPPTLSPEEEAEFQKLFEELKSQGHLLCREKMPGGQYIILPNFDFAAQEAERERVPDPDITDEELTQLAQPRGTGIEKS